MSTHQITRKSTSRPWSVQGVIATPADATATIARLALGIMILPHGLQKLFGLLGGYGFAGTMGYFTETLGIPWIFAFLAIVAEFFGGLGLITGLLGRVAAVGVGATLLVGALMSHAQHGFFMNWGGQLPAGQEGFEFHILAVALALIVILRGSGAWSIDWLLTSRQAD